MINGGNNGGGNPNHDENGRFTSGPNQAGNKVEEKQDYESKVKEQLGIKNDKEPSFEEKMQSTMGIKEPQKEKNLFDEAKKELQDMGCTVVGEQGDRVYEIATYGDKFYARTYRTNFDGPIESTEEEIQFKDANGNYVEDFDSVEEVVGALQKDGYPVYDGFKASEAPKKTEEDLRNFENTHKFEVVYDYDDNGNRNGYELKFENPEDQKAYEQLISEVYSDVDFGAGYEDKVKSAMGIQSPEPPEEDEKQKLWNSFGEEMKSSYDNDFEKFSKEYDEVKAAPEKDLEEKNKHRRNILAIKNAKSMRELESLKNSLLTKKLNGEINDEQWGQIATAYSNMKDILNNGGK